MIHAPRIEPLGRRRFILRAAASIAGVFALGDAKRAHAATTSIQPYLGQIMVISWNFPPKGWAFCNGQLLPINQNQALFSLLGTTYGGNGQTNFALPDLRDRLPIHWGQAPGLSDRALGEQAGESAHAILLSELPTHTHVARGATALANVVDPAGMYPARNPANIPQYSTVADTQMSDVAIAAVGGNQPHLNAQPSLTLNYVIALQGIFPTHP
jgi:microcystin-dependent protein